MVTENTRVINNKLHLILCPMCFIIFIYKVYIIYIITFYVFITNNTTFCI